MSRDPLWLNFPRWIQESSIPLILSTEIGLEAWTVFRKLVELDCEENLTPDWFSFRIDDIRRWTGISLELIVSVLSTLEYKKWIERINKELDVQSARIACPLPVEIDDDAVRQQLTGIKMKGGRFVLRYRDDLGMLEKVERVIYLYQMLFGARFSPRIVDDLEEIANLFPMELIYQLFQEAFQKNAKSLSWIKSRLTDSTISKVDD